MTKTLTELVILAGETNEKNGFNRYSEALIGGYAVEYLGMKDLLEVSEITEAQDELRKGNSPAKIYYSDGGKLEGYLIEKFDAHIRSFGTIYEIIRGHGLDVEETLAHLEAKLIYNATRADTAASGVKKF